MEAELLEKYMVEEERGRLTGSIWSIPYKFSILAKTRRAGIEVRRGRCTLSIYKQAIFYEEYSFEAPAHIMLTAERIRRAEYFFNFTPEEVYIGGAELGATFTLTVPEADLREPGVSSITARFSNIWNAKLSFFPPITLS